MNDYPTADARLQRVRELTGGKGPDVAVEVTGRPEAVAEGLEMLSAAGTYLSMGLVTGGLYSQIDMEKVVHKGLTIVGLGELQTVGHAESARVSREDTREVPLRQARVAQIPT